MPPKNRKEVVLKLAKSLETRVKENEKLLNAITGDGSSEKQAINKVNQMMEHYDQIIGDCRKNCHNPDLDMPDIREYLECIRKTTGLRDVNQLHTDLISVGNDPHPLMCENLLAAYRESIQSQDLKKQFDQEKKENQKKYDKLLKKDAEAADAYHQIADLSKKLEGQEKLLRSHLIEQSRRGLQLTYCAEELRAHALVHDYEVHRVEVNKTYEKAKNLLSASTKDLESIRECCAEIERLDVKMEDWSSRVYELISGFDEDVGNNLRNDEGDLELDPLMLHYADCFMRVGSHCTKTDRIGHKENKERLHKFVNNEIKAKGLQEVETHASEWQIVYEKLNALKQELERQAEQEKKTPEDKKKTEESKTPGKEKTTVIKDEDQKESVKKEPDEEEKGENGKIDKLAWEKAAQQGKKLHQWKQLKKQNVRQNRILRTKQAAGLLPPTVRSTVPMLTPRFQGSNGIFSGAGLGGTHNINILQFKNFK